MKSSNRISVLLACTTVAALVLGACQPQIVEKEVVVTQIVEKTVEKEVVVEKEKIVEVTTEDYTTPHPILSDVKVRQAIAHCTNRPEVIASVYSWLDDKAAILMDTQIPTSHWAYTKPKVQYAFDVAKGGALLDEAGWKLGEGADYRSDADGNELSLRFTTTSAQFRQTWAAVFESNMKDCGVRVVRLHAPASWWFGDTTGLARRDYELGAFAWVGDADPGGQSLYACDKIPLPSNGWEGQNGMGWCNEAASNAIKGANNTLDRAERVKQYAIFQEGFAADMPSLPMFNRVEVNATAADLAGFDPRPGQPYPTYNVADWERPGETTIILALSQEPASLFTLVENAFVATLASTLIQGVGITSLDYDFAANMYFTELPTLENKGATLVAVDVKDGDKVINAAGDVVELKSGEKIRVVDAAGDLPLYGDLKLKEIEYTGGGAQMPQMTMNWKLESGLKWSDGNPLVAADLELASKITCDPDSGATDFTVCERTAKETWGDTEYSIMLMPGYTPPLYFSIGPGWYPAHRKLSDGRKLADVPAKEWTTLAEIAESPIGLGPYTITKWEKGVSMSFAANPNFYKGKPKTPNITIKIVQDTNQAVAQLLTGDVDVVFGETLGAGEEVATVKEAADKGDVKIFFTPSATWEHVDFNLNTK